MSIELLTPPLALMKHRRFQRSKFHPFSKISMEFGFPSIAFRYASLTALKQYWFGYIIHKLYFLRKLMKLNGDMTKKRRDYGKKVIPIDGTNKVTKRNEQEKIMKKQNKITKIIQEEIGMKMIGISGMIRLMIF